jgi:hypothetical protein
VRERALFCGAVIRRCRRTGLRLSPSSGSLSVGHFLASPVKDTNSLPHWIAHVFDHPVTDPALHWSLDAPEWEDTPEHVASLIADTFEQSGTLLTPFSDAQLEQAFWFLVSGTSDFMFALVDESVPLATRLRALHSFIPLFQQVMAVRCSPHLSHLDEPGANPLNGSCYMWWDILPIHGKPEEPQRAEFDAEVLRVLPQILSIEHDACRESALHGISEWQLYYPSVADIVDDFLSRTPNLRPELISYARRAKIGMVQ